jgi:hypothetical protein
MCCRVVWYGSLELLEEEGLPLSVVANGLSDRYIEQATAGAMRVN